MSVPQNSNQYRMWLNPAPVDPAKVALLNIEPIFFYQAGKPAAGPLWHFLVPVALTIPANCVGSITKALTGATAATTFTVTQNGTTICTFAYAAGGQGGAQTGTFSTQAAISLNAGDFLTVTAPTQDATLANLGLTLYALYY